MQIGFFGRIATPFGGMAEISVPDAGLTVAQIRWMLSEAYDTEMVLERTVRAAVNDEFVADTHLVGAMDRVEFMSPVSGG